MRFTSKSIVIEYLKLMIEKSQLVIDRNQSIINVHDSLSSPERMEKFDAACMLVQVIGETAKKIDDWTSSQLFCHYPQVYWRGVFGCRNIISHEYGNVDPQQIFSIIKKYLPELISCVTLIIEDLQNNKHDSLFEPRLLGSLTDLDFQMPYLLKDQCIPSPVSDIKFPLRKWMEMNIIKINTDNFTLTVTMDEILSPIYQFIKKAVIQPVIVMGKQGITLAPYFVRGVESHGGMIGVKQCPLIGERVFFHAVREV